MQGRIAFGPAAGWRIPRIVDPDKATALYRPGKLCAQYGGFSLHAKVRVAACARQWLEKLCRYVARVVSENSADLRTNELRPRLPKPESGAECLSWGAS